jgi:hypothetical protein
LFPKAFYFIRLCSAGMGIDAVKTNYYINMGIGAVWVLMYKCSAGEGPGPARHESKRGPLSVLPYWN